jgi:putative transcriptional regulator
MKGSLKGHLLMAMPGLADPNFARSVTLICEHTGGGAMGVTIDRISPNLTADMIFRELGIDYWSEVGATPIYHGGPVHVDEIFILHGPPFTWEGCLMVTASIALSNTLDLLNAIAREEGPKSFMILIGCAGWGEGQLEDELRQNAWVTCKADQAVIFDAPADKRWEMAMNQMGINPDLLSNFSGNA